MIAYPSTHTPQNQPTEQTNTVKETPTPMPIQLSDIRRLTAFTHEYAYFRSSGFSRQTLACLTQFSHHLPTMIYNEALPLATLTCRNELDMVLIYKKKLVQFWGRRTDSKKHLENWCRKIENNYFCTSSQLRDEFPKIRLIGGGQAVFNVKNNRYRLIVKFYFENGVVQVCWIGTHSEYDRIDAKAVCDDLAA